MRIIKPKTGNFRKFHEEKCENTILMENASQFEPYVDLESSINSTSERNLHIMTNYIITKYLNVIKETAVEKQFTYEEQKNYDRNPKRLSFDFFGTVDYWYIILAINGYSSRYEFVGVTQILLPDPRKIASILSEEEFIRNS